MGDKWAACSLRPPLLHLPVQCVGDAGFSLRLRVPNLGDLNPDPLGEVSLSLAKAPSFSFHLQWLSLSCKDDPSWAGMDPASSTLCAATRTPLPWHTHTQTHALSLLSYHLVT